MNYPTSALAKYRTVSITTGSPAQVTVMLYDAIFRLLREAMTAITEGDRARSGERVGKAHGILKHLLGSMVPEANPLLHERLTSLYMFAMHHSTLANLKRDPAMLQQVIDVLLPLRAAWNTASNRAAAAAEAPTLARTG